MKLHIFLHVIPRYKKYYRIAIKEKVPFFLLLGIVHENIDNALNAYYVKLYDL